MSDSEDDRVEEVRGSESRTDPVIVAPTAVQEVGRQSEAASSGSAAAAGLQKLPRLAAKRERARLAQERHAQTPAPKDIRVHEGSGGSDDGSYAAPLSGTRKRKASDDVSQQLAAMQRKLKNLERKLEAAKAATKVEKAGRMKEKEAKEDAMAATKVEKAGRMKEKEAKEAAMAATKVEKAGRMKEKEAKEDAMAATKVEKEAKEAAIAATKVEKARRMEEKEAKEAAIALAKEREKEAKEAAVAYAAMVHGPARAG